MNIKSLLLGSAALATASTGALAADAIVVPDIEPMEYVRICDVYGPGFFYIPGTETCIKIGGYFRYDMTAVLSNSTGVAVGPARLPLLSPYFASAAQVAARDDAALLGRLLNIAPGVNPGLVSAPLPAGSTGLYETGWSKLARFAPSFDVRSDTEIGTIKGFAEVEFNFRSGLGVSTYAATSMPGTSLNLAQAYIQILRPSGHSWLFGRTTNPYYGVLGGFGVGGISSGAVALGYAPANQVQWGYANGKHTFQAALLDNSVANVWVPNIEAAYRYGSATSGWGFIGIAARYRVGAGGVGAFGGKVATHINFGNSGVAWRAQVGYDSVVVAGGTGATLTAGTGLNVAFSPKASAYLMGVGTTTAATMGAAVAATADYSAVLGAQFTAAPGFTINPEVQYNFGATAATVGGVAGAATTRNNLNVALRLQRSF